VVEEQQKVNLMAGQRVADDGVVLAFAFGGLVDELSFLDDANNIDFRVCLPGADGVDSAELADVQGEVDIIFWDNYRILVKVDLYFFLDSRLICRFLGIDLPMREYVILPHLQFVLLPIHPVLEVHALYLVAVFVGEHEVIGNGPIVALHLVEIVDSAEDRPAFLGLIEVFDKAGFGFV
jgi:hypothetical protein